MTSPLRARSISSASSSGRPSTVNRTEYTPRPPAVPALARTAKRGRNRPHRYREHDGIEQARPRAKSSGAVAIAAPVHRWERCRARQGVPGTGAAPLVAAQRQPATTGAISGDGRGAARRAAPHPRDVEPAASWLRASRRSYNRAVPPPQRSPGRVFSRSTDEHARMAVRGEASTIWDAAGRAYIDAAGGAIVVGVGHGRRSVAEAMAEQASRVAFAHGSAFTSEPLERYASAIAPHLPL